MENVETKETVDEKYYKIKAKVKGMIAGLEGQREQLSVDIMNKRGSLNSETKTKIDAKLNVLEDVLALF